MPTLSRELAELYYEGKPLTPMQRKVLTRIALGDTGPQAAAYLGRSPETVKRQLRIVRAKLHARTTAQAVAIAVVFDLI